ncbi:hypothetical protein ABK040_015838 [Willaertia magna]
MSTRLEGEGFNSSCNWSNNKDSLDDGSNVGCSLVSEEEMMKKRGNTINMGLKKRVPSSGKPFDNNPLDFVNNNHNNTTPLAIASNNNNGNKQQGEEEQNQLFPPSFTFPVNNYPSVQFQPPQQQILENSSLTINNAMNHDISDRTIIPLINPNEIIHSLQHMSIDNNCLIDKSPMVDEDVEDDVEFEYNDELNFLINNFDIKEEKQRKFMPYIF